ncbi:MAG: MBL fold metallo-hydrolase [Myxococcota bacterium]
MPELIFIGTGDAFGSGGRRNSAILVRGAEGNLLLDCGPSTLVGMKQLGIDPLEIDAVAISHYHGDHASGLPFLLLDYIYEGRRHKPLQILGPQGIEERVERLNKSCEYGMERPYEVSFEEFNCESSCRAAGFRLVPYPARHHPETCPHMIRVEGDGRALFFSGDTGWHDSLPQTVGDVDLFISEATLFEETFEFHLSCLRLLQERSRFRCRRMILTHLGREVLENQERIGLESAEDGLCLEF